MIRVHLFRQSAARLTGLLVVAMIAAGCGAEAEPAIITVAPSATNTPDQTQTAVALVVTPTVTATFTASPPPPVDPGAVPTSIIAPTFSPAPVVYTATVPATLAGLEVEYFTTDVQSVMPGENVTLYWSVRGADRARIFRLDDTGERIWRWDVAGEGRLTVGTSNAAGEAASFLITADANGATVEQPLLIPLRCTDAWFFTPAPEGCPVNTPESSAEAEQTFEHGRMIWVESRDQIYVIFEDGASPGWAQYPDNFEDGMPERDESLVPPSGLSQPIRGFGLVWRSTPRVQERLGWAASPEVSFEGMLQADSIDPGSATLYLRARDGGILALDASANEWELLPAPAADESTTTQSS
ncbi:MAG TPA: hypothetical protein PKD09_15685 [Aggregatilinea sp.]|jgi:hypothetical protein|uniref:hypothetical protein n=1 Tax=Aggregatilinea sp. TaxID=2806333 RepID=UPI002CD9C3AC|nr:hypothetical protein [Aggregatilinea sp.]HML23095.1 hypothetical protein [Aggregatilinea sp.]